MGEPEWLSALTRDGACVAPEPVSSGWLSRADRAFARLFDGPRKAGTRSGLDDAEIADLVREPLLRQWADLACAGPTSAVRAIAFDKNPAGNWAVSWHQDRVVALAERRDVPGFSEWSNKRGVVHAHAPAWLLEQMVALRIHLDPCDAGNGALRTVPGSQRLGVIPEDQVDAAVGRGSSRRWDLERGGVLMMRPLALHASDRAGAPDRRRRVLHVELAPDLLPPPLRWHWSVS